MSKIDLNNYIDFMAEYKKEISKEYEEEKERLNNVISNMEEELMTIYLRTIYLDIMEYNEDYAEREIKKLKGVDKE